MKRSKKLLSLVLALMMALSCMVMPAMAAGEDEGIMPRYVVQECPNCFGSVREGKTTVTPSRMNVVGCDKRPDERHDHYVYLEETLYYCTSCPYSYTYARSYMGGCV